MNSLLLFLKGIKTQGLSFFIEAEAKPTRMQKFIDDYNRQYRPNINQFTDGIIELQKDADKWGLELRLYVPTEPTYSPHGFTKNRAYRGEYSYRLNDNNIIEKLFERGYCVGLN